MAYLGANAAWHMGQWEEMATYVGALESEEGPELSTGSFLSAVLNVHHGNFDAARCEAPVLLSCVLFVYICSYLSNMLCVKFSQPEQTCCRKWFFGDMMQLWVVLAGCIERSRELLGQELSALVGESYERAYQNMVRVQQLTELEETIDYSLAFHLAQSARSHAC